MEEKKTYRTMTREKISEYLVENADKTFTAADIMMSLQEDGIDVNITTVYRYLNKLNEDGIVNKYVASKGEMAKFQHAQEKHKCDDHLHMQCVRCKRVIHLDCEFMTEIAGHIMEHHGFSIECRGSIIYGLCDSCRKKTA